MAQRQVELAGRGRRFLAALIDGLCIAVVNWLIFRRTPPDISSSISSSAAYTLIWFTYVWVQHGWWAQTLGKRAMGIKVIHVNFDEIGWRTAAWRGGFELFFSLITCGVGGFIDLSWILWDRDNQSLHDKVAKTWVVNV
ncbi:RDD family protein [Actinoallomurus sp. CA-150999]|uniref:RDD family protein n=1 Tax=Actinoallomurus sp. CA-150999 TaxID=3239887 RepID=UPI003D8A3760